jgi:D-alanyl-D-alanine carboxypeptidase (penicillin-binding protein 5/6)
MKKFFACFIFTLLFAFALSASNFDTANFDASNFDTANFDAAVLHGSSVVLLDAATGTVLFQKNPNELIPPASLTKIMTMHLALVEAKRRSYSIDEKFDVPPESYWRNQPPRSSLMYLDEGQRVSLRELLLGLSIPSGNDAAVAVALRFAPTVDEFAAMMNTEARRFGLDVTYFVEPSGVDERNITSALEFARLCQEYLRLHPEALKDYHTAEEMTYPKPENMPEHLRYSTPFRVHRNHVGLLGYDGRPRYPGADGLKTGYIDESGYNIAATAERDGTRLIAVILGVPANVGAYWGPRFREADAAALFDWGFASYKTIRFPLPAFADAKIWKGKKGKIKVRAEVAMELAAEDAVAAALTVPKLRGDDLTFSVEMIKNLIAPIPAGTVAGQWIINDSSGELAKINLLTRDDVPRGNALKRAWDAIVMFFMGIK